MPDQPATSPYDALLLLSFGGPEGPDDVLPFLENVTRGRGIPRERLKEVGQHYFLFGGVSPINEQNRALLDALRTDFAEHGLDLPVYWGNRNWAPYLTDTLREMVADGHRRIPVLATSAYASYSGCRQYRENLADALAALEAEGLELPRVDKLRHYFNHPGFVGPMVDGVLAVARRPARRRSAAGAHLAFTTHSIPTAAADTSGPGRATATAARTSPSTWTWPGWSPTPCARRPASTTPGSSSTSRAAAPRSIPWLEPDICDHLEDRCTARGCPPSSMVPIGFVSDHMEVLYDLDTEAAAKAAELGLPVRRSRHRRSRPALRRRRTRARAGAGRDRARPSRASAAPSARSARATTCARSAAARPVRRDPPPRAPTAPTPESEGAPSE